MAAMSVKMDRFCQEYVIDYNGTEAAVRAGYSEKRAAAQASTLLRRADVMTRVAELQREQTQRLGLSSDRVVMELWEIYKRCMQAEPVMVWDPVAHEKVPSDAEYTFDANGAVKALKLIGEHIGMWNRTELKLTDETAQSKLAQLLERLDMT